MRASSLSNSLRKHRRWVVFWLSSTALTATSVALYLAIAPPSGSAAPSLADASGCYQGTTSYFSEISKQTGELDLGVAEEFFNDKLRSARQSTRRIASVSELREHACVEPCLLWSRARGTEREELFERLLACLEPSRPAAASPQVQQASEPAPPVPAPLPTAAGQFVAVSGQHNVVEQSQRGAQPVPQVVQASGEHLVVRQKKQ